ncbi:MULTISPECIES: M14 family metallopeptidase [unclassified Minwuia]|uniref:M14 family metallopeptidase n=1 Tax=unclassified Minwuia TaxID=2618799 RepID=UPI00247AF591|nr:MULTISPECIES: M14 family metallopeptidase [unclassified Minwuia]
MSENAWFSADYRQARGRFLDAAADVGARVETHENPVPGPNGGPLATDVAFLGDPQAEAALLTFSGTHGAEGFCGSGVQVGWLESGLWREVPDGIAQIHVHGINPFGFAHLSRTTEDNVDLNRNFVDFAAGAPVNAGYETIHDILCPKVWDDEAETRLAQGVAKYTEEHGFWAFQEAATSGQHTHRDGIFFGGTAPSWSRLTVARLLATHCSTRRRLAVIDYHTGLGPRGFGERIVDHLPDTAGYQRCLDWYDSDCASPHLGTSASAKLTGQMLDAIEHGLPQVEVTAIALEYGTQPENQVISALCVDNWLRFHGDVSSPKGRDIKARVREAFYQDALDWKQAVFERALDTQRRAIRGLQG